MSYGNGNVNVNFNHYSFIFNRVAAWWKHTPQSLRDSSPNLGEQFLYLSIFV